MSIFRCRLTTEASWCPSPCFFQDTRPNWTNCPYVSHSPSSFLSETRLDCVVEAVFFQAVFLRAGVEVDWSAEKECFDSLLRELAFFYIPGPIHSSSSSASSSSSTAAVPASNAAETEIWQIQHILFPALKQYLQPPSKLSQGAVTQLCSLENLYKVFERVRRKNVLPLFPTPNSQRKLIASIICALRGGWLAVSVEEIRVGEETGED
jgi:DNA mismatch repair protein Mlh1 C-terminus